jgi:hypothetical protein
MRALAAMPGILVVFGLTLVGCPGERTDPESSGSIERSEPRPEDRARIRELEAENRRLRTVLRAAESTDGPSPEAFPSTHSIMDAKALYAGGDALAAVQSGLLLLDELNDGGVAAPNLAFLLGRWALEADEPSLAERLFREAAAGAELTVDLAETAAMRATVARAAALGPDAAAFAEAEALLEVGDLGAASSILAELMDSGEDAAILGRADDLFLAILDESAELALERLDRADALLEGPGPWGPVGQLLDGVEGLPEGTWDVAEVRRLRAWYRSRSREDAAGEADVEVQRLQSVLEEARGHVAAERYRDAVAKYRDLEGTSLQTRARDESRSAIDTLVKAERERAGRMFLAARKKPDATLKKSALEEVAGLLRSLLDEFPTSTYATRVRDNLTVVEKELATL